jgi:hypothetical protein
MRAYALRNFLIPRYVDEPAIDELIVAGEWEEGEGYTYVPCPSTYFNCRDALAQRQAGFEASTGDVVIFQHDDHLLESRYQLRQELNDGADVVVPGRWTRLRDPDGEPLNNGYPDYISGHCALYQRAVIERCPWKDVPPEYTWDQAHTQQIRAAEFTIVWARHLTCWDVEMGSTPWQ